MVCLSEIFTNYSVIFIVQISCFLELLIWWLLLGGIVIKEAMSCSWYLISSHSHLWSLDQVRYFSREKQLVRESTCHFPSLRAKELSDSLEQALLQSVAEVNTQGQ